MTELECVIICPRCYLVYGQVNRVLTDNVWRNEPDPDPIPKYCTVCEIPTERKVN